MLVVFSGPHAYASPAWYVDRVTVPTWNYAAVHVRGRARLIRDPARLREIVSDLVRHHEAGLDPCWTLDEAGDELERNLGHIVGLEIPIDRIEGTFKFNQNRSREDRLGVVRALESSSDSRQREVAEIIRRGLVSVARIDMTATGRPWPDRAAAGGETTVDRSDSDWIACWTRNWGRGW